MKKTSVIGITFLFIFLFLFASCEEILEEEIPVVSATASATWDYENTNPVAEISPTTREVRLEGLQAGQKVYLAKVNPTDTAFDKELVRKVETATGVKLTTTKRTSASSRSALEVEESYLDEDSELSEIVDVVVEPEFNNSREAIAATPLEVANRAEFALGDKTQLYISHGLKNGNLASFYKESATLCAIGDTCNVWVVDDCLSHSNYDRYLNVSRARNLADQFDRMYDKIRDVFGEESDRIFITKSELGDMKTYSRFGIKVNIVVYDIGNDYSASQKGSIVGYFSTKDYYLEGVASYSNAGKFLYIDSYYAGSLDQMAYSTLAHEFQHLIHFNMKKIRHGLSSATWYNEMMSMLTEDYIQRQIGIFDIYSPKNRLSRFLKEYRDIGLEFRNDKVLGSYASAYAFGAWLVREYGGEKILRELARNDCVDMSSVLNAVAAVSGTTVTSDFLLGQYAQACVFNNEDVKLVYDYPTFNQSPGPMTSIDLWRYTPKDSPDSVRGPILYGYNDQYELRPYGINLVEIGTVDSPGGVLIRFNETGAANQKLYIFIQ